MEVNVQEPLQANYMPMNHGFILVQTEKREQTVQWRLLVPTVKNLESSP